MGSGKYSQHSLISHLLVFESQGIIEIGLRRNRTIFRKINSINRSWKCREMNFSLFHFDSSCTHKLKIKRKIGKCQESICCVDIRRQFLSSSLRITMRKDDGGHSSSAEATTTFPTAQISIWISLTRSFLNSSCSFLFVLRVNGSANSRRRWCEGKCEESREEKSTRHWMR